MIIPIVPKSNSHLWIERILKLITCGLISVLKHGSNHGHVTEERVLVPLSDVGGSLGLLALLHSVLLTRQKLRRHRL